MKYYSVLSLTVINCTVLIIRTTNTTNRYKIAFDLPQFFVVVLLSILFIYLEVVSWIVFIVCTGLILEM